ncbi:MAG: DUF4105 domain-containing protein [bacterium]|nr:DUF4105 domain-containing protein [bacterium]
MLKKTLKNGVLFLIIFFAGFLIFVQPENDRDWTQDQTVLPSVKFNNSETVTIKNVRNINYRSTEDYDLAYYDRTISLNDLAKVWFVVEPFGKYGAAHTFVSFEFKNGTFLSISVEIRKEKGESFSPIKGLFRQYELAYVIADERDVLRLRTNYRKDVVRLYPIKTDKEKIVSVFKDMLLRANETKENPEFYNTILNNCTTNIIKHVRKFSDKKIPWWDFRYLMPETIDELAYELGLIDTKLSLEEARKYFMITDRAQKHNSDLNFSKAVRSFSEK